MPASGRRFVRAPGVRLAPLGEGWVAFSALSGETHVLNDEGVAILELLDAATPLSALDIAAQLADEVDVPAAELAITLAGAWGPLIDAGLVREHRAGA
ncbi:MAG: HPr-rel-A system PqqD family peptide chaperone [Rubrivivax sp.]|nr:HPr-rel-A system PqqD family peptide chaperone [Rubrivivax sp.]